MTSRGGVPIVHGRETPPTASELRRARDYLVGQIDLGLEGTENQMMSLGEQLLAYGKLTSAARSKRRLCAVTGAEVRAVAREFLRLDRLSLAVVSPMKGQDRLRRMLKL